MDGLLEHIESIARRDPDTDWYPIVTERQVAFAEEFLNLEFPPLLRQIYLKLSNGGVGPGFRLGGLPGGHDCAWGDVIESTEEIRRNEDSDPGWLPIIDWGCNQVTMIDCDDEFSVVTWLEGMAREEDYDFDLLMKYWVTGMSFDIETGEWV